MKVKDVGFDENGDVEHTTSFTLEERNRLAVYGNMMRNLSVSETEELDKFSVHALDYGSTKCRELNRCTSQ